MTKISTICHIQSVMLTCDASSALVFCRRESGARAARFRDPRRRHRSQFTIYSLLCMIDALLLLCMVGDAVAQTNQAPQALTIPDATAFVNEPVRAQMYTAHVRTAFQMHLVVSSHSQSSQRNLGDNNSSRTVLIVFLSIPRVRHCLTQ